MHWYVLVDGTSAGRCEHVSAYVHAASGTGHQSCSDGALTGQGSFFSTVQHGLLSLGACAGVVVLAWPTSVAELFAPSLATSSI
jgi:hypothetical protein